MTGITDAQVEAAALVLVGATESEWARSPRCCKHLLEGDIRTALEAAQAATPVSDHSKLIAEARALSEYVSEHIPGSRYKPMIDRLANALDTAPVVGEDRSYLWDVIGDVWHELEMPSIPHDSLDGVTAERITKIRDAVLVAGFSRAAAPVVDVEKLDTDTLAKILCRIEARRTGGSFDEVVAPSIERWTRHRYEAEKLLEEISDHLNGGAK